MLMAQSARNSPKTGYHWEEPGEKWSEPWGTSAARWYGAIFPRIHHCLPTNTILEIAPGFGRWTHYLKDYCEHLCVVDRAERQIEACRQRFAGDSRLSYHVNDGRSLKMIPDGSIDFIFSFDSLVHVRREIIETYVRQFAAKLKRDGMGFIHHSNLGEYPFSASKQIPPRVRKLLTKTHILESDQRRVPDMTGGTVPLLLRAERFAMCLPGKGQLARQAVD
jgi:ubiquinone/menaquinone biosynthesis C-methylase UbiE